MTDVAAEVRRLVAEALHAASSFPALIDILSEQIVTQVQECVLPGQLLSMEHIEFDENGVRCLYRHRQEVPSKLERCAFYATEKRLSTVTPDALKALASLQAITDH
jgi:hypothetical protein